jgi:hypothetical protein
MLFPLRPDLRSGKVKRKEIFNCTLEKPLCQRSGLRSHFVKGVELELSVLRKREKMG